MAASHEAIWVALLTRLRDGAPSFRLCSRQVRDWGLEQLPALEIIDSGNETPIAQDGGLLLGWKLFGEIAIVAREPQTLDASIDRSVFSALNDLIAEVKTALEWGGGDTARNGQITQFTNLGGLLAEFRIGPVTKGGGSLTGQVVAKFPIEMDVDLTD